MKILLASGASEIFTIGHCFRNLEGTGTWHHPEFLMLEWYRVNADYQQIIADTQALIAFCHRKFKPQAPALLWQTLSVEQLWQEKFGLSLAQVQAPAKLKRVARQHGYDDAGNWEQIFNQLFLNEIETAFPSTPFILSDFPARLSPLCAPKKKQPWLAERFEVYLQGREIGNGNTEQLDVASIRRLFQAEQQARLRRGQKPQPVDEEMLAAIRTLAHTGKTYAGMGLGIDRLALVLAELDDINQLWPRF
jgi:lysyl-tRNA synthetase class 2